jgi:hypothetical protein
MGAEQSPDFAGQHCLALVSKKLTRRIAYHHEKQAKCGNYDGRFGNRPSDNISYSHRVVPVLCYHVGVNEALIYA